MPNHLRKTIFVVPILLIFFKVILAREQDPGQSDLISQYGVTFQFDKSYPVGKFANGDYWVAGKQVVITRITPDFFKRETEYVNGWEINPLPDGKQGYASRAGNFDLSLVPQLPCKINAPSSVVKTIRSNKSDKIPYQTLRTAVVLTVLTEVPPEHGANMFRPPYVGNDKSFFSLDRIEKKYLRNYKPVPQGKSLNWVFNEFKRLQMDEEFGATGRYLHPIDNIPDYGAGISVRNNEAALALQCENSWEAKQKALIAYLQYGIDLFFMLKNGQKWQAGGGHRPGQKLPLAFAAVMLQDEEMKTAIKHSDVFNEDTGLIFSKSFSIPLYGFRENVPDLEEKYWTTLVSEIAGTVQGSKSIPDPYGHIDGGPLPGSHYQFCCTSQPWKGTVLNVFLMPELMEMWHGNDTLLFSYVNRWVTRGAHTQPDPCAPPPTSQISKEIYQDKAAFSRFWDKNYSITFGPDLRHPGKCITDTDSSNGIGRFPGRHGIEPDGGYWRSRFVDRMWNKHIRKTMK